MTVIAGCVDESNVIHFVSDTYGTGGINADHTNRLLGPKIFVISDVHGVEVAFGCAGSIRMAQIIQSMDIGEVTFPVYDWLTTTFVELLRKHFEANGLVPNGNMFDEINTLIGVDGVLYVLQEDLSIMWFEEPFAAIGSGASYAYGVYGALGSSVPCVDMLEKCVDVASTYCSSVGGRIASCEAYPVSDISIDLENV